MRKGHSGRANRRYGFTQASVYPAEAGSFFSCGRSRRGGKGAESRAGPLGKAWRTSGRKKPQKTTKPVDTSLSKSALTRIWQFWAHT
jgi:hypothetical protein